jgi:N-acyl-D-aspartate/D-glutamate deacylase
VTVDRTDHATYDLVIRNGRVVDGSGRPAFRADVGIVGDRIATLGRIRGRGRREIDAEGCYVTPGFVDGHTHFDAQICWDPLLTCPSWHGVTSVVMGNCGFTVAPCRDSEKDLALRSLERAEDMNRETLLAGVEWKWETFPEYLDAIDALPKGLNLAGYVGHSALRTYVMGERAYEAEATEDELAALVRHTEASLRAGAIGFSTSRSANHATADDHPVASRQASWGEVQALVGVMGDLGVGVYEVAHEHHADPAVQAEYMDRVRQLAVDTGRPVTFIIGASKNVPHVWRQTIEECELTAEAGGRMVGCVHAREFATVLSFEANLPFDKLPTWAPIRRQPLAAQKAALSDPTTRAKLVEEAMHGPYGQALGAEARKPEWDWVWLYDSPLPPHRPVSQLAAERGVTPVDVMIDAALATDFRQLFLQPFANHDQDAVLELLRHPRTVIGASDSGAHVSQITDASIPTHLLAHWVREREAFTWEAAVRKLTFDPAALWGFHDRGLVAEGFVADLNVFDPATVGPAMAAVAADLPAGSKRIIQKAHGFRATVVNGTVLMEDGEHTGAFPGRLLRGPLATR